MPVSVEVVDSINTIAALSGTVSLDIVGLPELINAIKDTSLPWYKDIRLWKELLPGLFALIGNIVMGCIAIWTTRKSIRSQEKIQKLTFEYERLRQEMDIRTKLATALFKLRKAAFNFEIDVQECLNYGTPKDTSKSNEEYMKDIQNQKIDSCLDSFQTLQETFTKLYDLVDSYVLNVDTNAIISHEVMNLYNTYLSWGERMETHTVIDFKAISTMRQAIKNGGGIFLSETIEKIIDQIKKQIIQIKVSQCPPQPPTSE